MSHLYCGLCSEMSLVLLVSSSDGSHVTMSGGLSVSMYLLGTRTAIYEDVCAHINARARAGTLAKTTQQLQCRHDGGDTQPSL